MKKKTLKKMLAIALAAMTVSATPGLVGAISEKSIEKIKNIEQKLEGNVMDEVDVTQALDDLEQILKDNTDDDTKVEVSKILGDMIDELWFGGIPAYGYMSEVHYYAIPRILNILDKCSECDGNLTIRKSKEYTYYACSSYVRKRGCKNKHTVRKDILEEKVITEINNKQAKKIDKLNRKYIFDLINMIYLNKDGSVKIELKKK